MAAPSPQAQTFNVIAFERVSGNDQDLARQKTNRERTAVKYGLHVVEVVRMKGVSGTDTFDHDEIRRIHRSIESNPNIHGILVTALDRLFRPGKSFNAWSILEPFRVCHKKIWSNAEGLFDLDSNEGMDKAYAVGVRAGAEWRIIAERSAQGHAETMALGRLPGGTPRYGWDYHRLPHPDNPSKTKGGEWVINEPEAAVAREMFALRRAGKATYQIACIFNDRGIRSKGNNGKPPKPWSRTTVLQLLTAREYIGEHLYKGEMFRVPRIVEDEDFFAVQVGIEASGKRWVGRPGSTFLLRNFCYCGHCDHRMVGHTKSGGHGHSSYRCGHKTNTPPIKRLCAARQIRAVLIEAAVWNAVWELLTQPAQLLAQGRAYYDARVKPDTSVQDEQRSELETLQRALENTISMCRKGYASFKTEEAGMNETRNRISFIEAELSRTHPVVELPEENVVASFLQEIADPDKDEPTPAEKRDILEGLDQLTVRYKDGEVEIAGAVPIPAVSAVGGNCYCRLDGASNSTPCIPFILKRRVA